MKFKVALAQTEPRLFDKAFNLEKAEHFIHQAALADAAVAVFPELHLTGYLVGEHAQELAELVDGPSVKRVAEMSRANHIGVIMGFVEQNANGGKPYDSVFITSAHGEILGSYRKMHLYRLEKECFLPGDEPQVLRSNTGRFGALICYDVEFPEAARLLALRGAQWLAVSTANMRPNEHLYDVVAQSRALENRVWLASANRVGGEETLEFFGRSAVSDPYGNIVAQAGSEECLLTIEIDLGRIDAARSIDTDYLADRRPALYTDLVKP
jgi:predicted amidohydrolase